MIPIQLRKFVEMWKNPCENWGSKSGNTDNKMVVLMELVFWKFLSNVVNFKCVVLSRRIAGHFRILLELTFSPRSCALTYCDSNLSIISHQYLCFGLSRLSQHWKSHLRKRQSGNSVVFPQCAPTEIMRNVSLLGEDKPKYVRFVLVLSNLDPVDFFSTFVSRYKECRKETRIC